MALPVYLAMTAEEMRTQGKLPTHLAYMACHFSPYGPGLSNLPQALPPDSLLIVNDRIPMHKHDPELIAQQLQKVCKLLSPAGILLDLERKEEALALQIVKAIVDSAPCPVAVTQWYAQDLSCPVFLGPVPLHMTLSAHIAPWEGRELWLEAALDSYTYTVTETGCTVKNCAIRDALPFRDDQLHCHYGCSVAKEQIVFTLQRTREDLQALLEEAKRVTRVIGLYQELGQ